MSDDIPDEDRYCDEISDRIMAETSMPDRARLAIETLIGVTNVLDHVDITSPEVLYRLIQAASSAAIHVAIKSRILMSGMSAEVAKEVDDEATGAYRKIESTGQIIRARLRHFQSVLGCKSEDLPALLASRRLMLQAEAKLQATLLGTPPPKK